MTLVHLYQSKLMKYPGPADFHAGKWDTPGPQGFIVGEFLL